MQEHHTLKLAGGLRGLYLLLGLAALTSTTACTSVGAPCLAYAPTYLTKTVSLRGYGSVQMTEEKLVCTERAEVSADD